MAFSCGHRPTGHRVSPVVVVVVVLLLLLLLLLFLALLMLLLLLLLFLALLLLLLLALLLLGGRTFTPMYGPMMEPMYDLHIILRRPKPILLGGFCLGRTPLLFFKKKGGGFTPYSEIIVTDEPPCFFVTRT